MCPKHKFVSANPAWAVWHMVVGFEETWPGDPVPPPRNSPCGTHQAEYRESFFYLLSSCILVLRDGSHCLPCWAFVLTTHLVCLRPSVESEVLSANLSASSSPHPPSYPSHSWSSLTPAPLQSTSTRSSFCLLHFYFHPLAWYLWRERGEWARAGEVAQSQV